MNLKRRISVLLASVMMAGTIGTLGMIPAYATGETNTFTLTVPADTSITAVGWNDIGSVGVSDVSIESGIMIVVMIENGAEGRNLINTADASKKVGYEIKKGTSATNEAFGDILEFTANGTQTLGAVVSDFSSAAAGTYQDTINFTAALKNAAPEAPSVADVFKENTEFTMTFVTSSGSFTFSYKNEQGVFVPQLITQLGNDVTATFKDQFPVTDNNPSFTFTFANSNNTLVVNTSTMEYTRTGSTPEMTSFMVDGVELINALTDKTGS